MPSSSAHSLSLEGRLTLESIPKAPSTNGLSWLKSKLSSEASPSKNYKYFNLGIRELEFEELNFSWKLTNNLIMQPHKGSREMYPEVDSIHVTELSQVIGI